MGNLIRSQLLKNPHVIFAGYIMPHPLEHVCQVKVQTTGGEYTPKAVFQEAISDLLEELDKVYDLAKEEFDRGDSESAVDEFQ